MEQQVKGVVSGEAENTNRAAAGAREEERP